jgi:hypothetical protein
MGVGMGERGFRVIGVELEASVRRISKMIKVGVVGVVGEVVKEVEKGGVAIICCAPKASISEISNQQSFPSTPS